MQAATWRPLQQHNLHHRCVLQPAGSQALVICYAFLQIFEHLDVLVSTMECGSDEAAQQLDLLHAPLLGQLRQAGRPQAAVVALSLLATLCEQRPEAAEDLRQQGAVAAVVTFLLNGASQWAKLLVAAAWAASP